MFHISNTIILVELTSVYLTTMALIKCSECGNMISDKSESCVHCGAPMELKENLIPCPECSALIEDTAERCPMCGYPVIPKRKLTPCPECGKMVEEDTEECPECGYPIYTIPNCYAERGERIICSTTSTNPYRKLYKERNNNRKNKIIVTLICIGLAIYFAPKDKAFYFPGLFPQKSSSEYSRSSTRSNSNNDEYKESDRERKKRDKQNDLTVKLLKVEEELREVVDELGDIYNTKNGNTGLRGMYLKQRVVTLYQKAIEIASDTGDASLVREYERRKEKAVSAMQRMN